MSDQDRKFWPFRPRSSIVSSITILIGFLLLFVILKKTDLWPTFEKSDTTILIGILLFSLLPVLLSLVDIIIERGGIIEYGRVKIDFSQVSQAGMSGFTVPTNIGVRGEAIGDSDTNEILEALKQATACQIVIIDLEDGDAWWETRLLVLLSGAVRLHRPEKVVFVGREGGVDQCFQGWGYAFKLLPYLLKAHPQYLYSFNAAMAANRQWQLVEPVNPPNPITPGATPVSPGWISGGLALQHPWMAFDGATGLPNELLAEQLLASDLGQQVESEEGPRNITNNRLRDLFGPVLYQGAIEIGWSAERQLTEFFDSPYDQMAITQKGKYLAITSRLSILNTFIRSMVEKK